MEIPQLLDATDISNGIVDERSIMTYLSMIHHAISLKVPSEVLSLPLLLLLSLLLPSSSLLSNRDLPPPFLSFSSPSSLVLGYLDSPFSASLCFCPLPLFSCPSPQFFSLRIPLSFTLSSFPCPALPSPLFPLLSSLYSSPF